MNENSAETSADPNTEVPTEAPTEAMVTPEMAELEADIVRTREDLAQTVDQLTAKLDVKSRIRGRATEAKDAAAVQLHSARQQLVDGDGRPRPAALRVGGGVVAGVLAVILVKLWYRRR